MAIDKKDATPRTSVAARKFTVGTSVIVGIAAAVALAILLNYLSHAGYWRKDFQTLGQYGLSDRTKKILDGIDEPVTLTVIYASPDKARLGRKYGPRVLELCREMGEYNDKISVVDANDDESRLEVIQRLRETLGDRAAAHRKLIERFEEFAARAATQLPAEAGTWRQRRSAKLLAGFRLPVLFTQALDDTGTRLKQATEEMAGHRDTVDVPDYAAIARQAGTAARQVRQTLETLAEVRQGISRLLKALAENDEVVKEAGQGLAALDGSVKQYLAALGGPADPVPDDPAVVLKRFTATGAKLLDELGRRKAAIDRLVKAHAIINSHERFNVNVSIGMLVRPVGPDQLLSMAAGRVRQFNAQAARVLRDEPVHVQKTFLQNLRTKAGGIGDIIAQAGQSWQNMLADLADPDPASRAALDQPDSLAELSTQAGEIADDADKLPKLEKSDLGQQIIASNVVLLDLADKTDVVGFDDVWPAAQRQTGVDDEEGPRRIFNGNQALGGRLLAATQKPLAEVLLTYFQWMPPQQMQGQIPPVFSAPARFRLNTLVETLKSANLVVTDWNLAGSDRPGAPPSRIPDPPPAKEGLPRVLVVLPAPMDMSMPQRQQMPLPKFTPQHLAKVTELVDKGTPAIFLTSFTQPMMPGMPQQNDPITTYLRESWAVNVESDKFIIVGELHRRNPEMFDISLTDSRWTPLSSFSDHPIGKPLRAQQLHWSQLCPVIPVEKVPDTIRITPILGPTADRRNLWAESDIYAVAAKEFRNVQPGPDDTIPPFSVVVEAIKTEKEQPSRIVVASVALTYDDAFLSAPVPRITAAGTLDRKTPPPVRTLDLLVNSCYWLADRQAYIGAGPTDLKPVGFVTQGEMTTLKFLVIGIWPALVLAAGVVVMVIRRRH